MASIKRRPDGRWRARYRDDAGKEHARHFGRKVDAQRWLDETTASIVTGAYVDPKGGRTVLRTYAKRWETNQVGSDATARIVDNALRLHILPRLGDRPLGAIRRSDVQSLVKGMADGYAPGSVRNVYDVLTRMLAAAVDDRLIGHSPCRRVTLPRMSDEEITPPTVEDVAALAGAVPARYRAVVVFLAGSGLRIGETLGLRVADVDFLRRTVRVERQRYQSGSIGATKGRRSRTVPLGQVVIDELAAHLAAYPSGEWLFTVEAGDALAYRPWRHIWSRDADVDRPRRRHARPEALLRLHAHRRRREREAGTGRAGHSSAVITLRTYAHLWPDEEDRTRSVADAKLGVLRTGCGLDGSEQASSAGQSV